MTTKARSKSAGPPKAAKTKAAETKAAAKPAATKARATTNAKAKVNAAKAERPKTKSAKAPAKSAAKAEKKAAKAKARSSDRGPNGHLARENGILAAGNARGPTNVTRVGSDAKPQSPTKLVSGGASQVESMEVRGKYVYCIIEATEAMRFGPVGIGSEPAEVSTVGYRDIAAVVSDTALEVHEPTRDNVLAHERVNETVMKKHTVIPMSFGTVFKTRDDIIELLRSAYDAFKDVLVKMRDKVEYGLKVLWDRDDVLREIEAEDEGIQRLKDEISSQKGSTYFARMQYGRLVDGALQARSERYVAEILSRLRDVAVASRTNKPIGDKMIMNAAFLVSRDKEQAFDTKVKEIGALYEKLTFRYTGPWPPYNFVNIRLKLERARAAE